MTYGTHTVDNFTAGGKAHRMLRAMTRGPQSIEALYALVDAETFNRRSKTRFILRRLKRKGAIEEGGTTYTILEPGLDLLDALDSPPPNVRIFAKESA